MKWFLVLTVVCIVIGRGRKESPVQVAAPVQPQPSPAIAKAPDCDKPEQFLWSVMIGDRNYSVWVKLIAAITFIGGQVAIELIKSWR